MYESFYGMKEKVFNLSPDPEYFYLSRGHENAFTHLEYAISENKAFAVVTGEIGAGKTTLINYLLYKIQLDIQIGLINNTNIPASQFLRTVCSEFELDIDKKTKVQLMDVFQNFLLEQYASNNRVLLIIDEAQNLAPKIIEEIRMVSNLEAEKSHLIQIILVGQPELKIKLQRMDLIQFAQRVSVHCHLNGLDKEEVAEYIRYRLKVGEAKNLELFDSEAIDMIYEYSRGIPRLINILCDTALVYGYADGMQTINEHIIKNVINEREQSGIFNEAESGGLFLGSTNNRNKNKGDTSYTDLKSIENRIGLLESSFDNLKENIKNLSNYQERRDKIIYELYKMLENSMRSRMHLLSLIGRLKNIDLDEENLDYKEEQQNISIVKD